MILMHDSMAPALALNAAFIGMNISLLFSIGYGLVQVAEIPV